MSMSSDTLLTARTSSAAAQTTRCPQPSALSPIPLTRASLQSFLYDGKTGQKIAELGGGAEPAHKGGVYALSWSPDGKRAITASGDKTVKLWDIEANTAVTTFTFGDDLEWQQLGCLWQGSTMISVSLNGYINYLDPNEPSRPRMTVKGSVKAATALAAKPDAGHFYAGSYDGLLRRFLTQSFISYRPHHELGHQHGLVRSYQEQLARRARIEGARRQSPRSHARRCHPGHPTDSH